LWIEFFKISIPLLFAVLIGVALLMRVTWGAISMPLLLMYAALLMLLLLIMCLVLYLATKKGWDAKKYIVDTKNVHVVNGVWQATHSYNSLSGVVSFNVDQSFFGRYFDYGTITLNFFGGVTVCIENVAYPEKTLERIQVFIEEAKGKK
jgi:hypothetical protein